MTIPEKFIRRPVDSEMFATELVEGWHYMEVVLREDQFDLIRQIVREEVSRVMESRTQ